MIRVRVEAFSPDADGDPLVKLFYDGALVGESGQAPYEFDLPVGEAGGHLVHVAAQLADGPTALSHKHIIVSKPHLENRADGLDGRTHLPGPVVHVGGIYLSSSNEHYMGSTDGVDWRPAAMPASVSGPSDFVAGRGIVVAKATSESVVVTRDGVNWIEARLPGTPVTPIYFSHGYFWAVVGGNFSPSGIMISEDGINWTVREALQGLGTPRDAAGDPNGILLAQPYQSTVRRSTDGGVTWTELPQYQFVRGLSHDGERFYMKVEEGGIRKVGSSVDGLNWTWSEPDARYSDLVLVDGTPFVFSGDSLVAVSHDGLSWINFETPRSLSNLIRGSDGYFYGIFDESFGPPPVIFRSRDGLSWEEYVYLPSDGVFELIVSDDGLFANSLDGGFWKLTPDTAEWTELFSDGSSMGGIFDLASGDGSLVAIESGTRILHSDDTGDTWWTVHEVDGSGPNPPSFESVMFLDGVWLAHDPEGALLRSTDARDFQEVDGAQDFEVVGRTSSIWMAIRNDGAVLTSGNGLDWLLHAPPGTYPDSPAYRLTHHGGVWYALSDDPARYRQVRMLSSVDGLAWTATSMPSQSVSSRGVVAFTSAGVIAGTSSPRFSSDFGSWTISGGNLSVFTHDDAFHAIKNGWLERSVDGTNWEPVRRVGEGFSYGKSIDGTIFLFGDRFRPGNPGRIIKLLTHDVSVSDVQAAPGDYGVGDSVAVDFVLRNEGDDVLVAGEYEVEFLLSADGFRGNADDSEMGSAVVSVPMLQPGESTGLQILAIIPNGTPPERYKVGIFFHPEAASLEAISSNNFGLSVERPVNIPARLLSTSTLGDGEIDQDSRQRLVAHGSRVSLNATAGKGAAFAGWAGDALGTESQITILMDSDKTVVANFSSRAALRTHVRGHGRVSGTGDEGLFPVGAIANLEAIPEAGWTFSHWAGAVGGEAPGVQILMDAPKDLTAIFVLSREAWRSLHFSAAELGDPLISGDDVDADGDGLLNWQEYVHLSDPMDPESRGIKRVALDGGFLTMIFTRHSSPEPGYGFTCEASRDMVDWDAPDLQERVLDTRDGVETVEARLPQAGHSTGFLRFNHQRPSVGLSMQAWKERYFSPAELLDLSISGEGVDADTDGLENWKEYLHGSDPRDPASRGIVETKVEGGFFRLTFTRLVDPEGSYRLVCEGSRELISWDAPDLEEQVLSTTGDIETVEARLPRTGHGSGFLRFNYQQ